MEVNFELTNDDGHTLKAAVLEALESCESDREVHDFLMAYPSAFRGEQRKHNDL